MARNLTLARGRLYFAEFAPGTQVAKGERFVGNCSEMTITTETNKLDHITSTHGLQVKDDSVVISNNRTGSIVTDDMSEDNISVFTLGIAQAIAISAGTTLNETFTDVVGGMAYQLGTSTNRPEGLRKVTGVTVTGAVLGTDYLLDAARGRITVIEGGVLDGDDMPVAYGNTAYSISRISAGSTEREGQLRWISDNPKGPQHDHLFPWVKLSPNGDLSLVSGEEWATLPLSIEVLEKDGMAPWYTTGEAVTV